MATEAQLLGVLQAAPGKPHHGCLRVVEGGALAVQAVGTVLNHVELLQLDDIQGKKLGHSSCRAISGMISHTHLITTLFHLVGKSVGLSRLVIERVSEDTAHHGNVLLDKAQSLSTIILDTKGASNMY